MLKVLWTSAVSLSNALILYIVYKCSKEARRYKDDLDKEKLNRKSERAGRIRFEQEVRRLQLQIASTSNKHAESNINSGDDGSSAHSQFSSFPFRPIGYMKSCFSQRNGTPRQPLLVPLARSKLQLDSDIPASSLEGLEQYSHCWILYVFHQNTDLVKTLQGDRSAKHSKINVPRLNGGKMGVLATRSPHRPVPIGLSVATVLGVKGNSVLLGGADIVDGSPVLDIKPYVPFCDAVRGAQAPAWVTDEAVDEPLKLSSVEISSTSQAVLAECWRSQRGQSMYATADEFISFVKQVLSRDIRALHKRLGGSQQEGLYHVILEGVDVMYDMTNEGVVKILGAELGGSGGRVLLTDHTDGAAIQNDADRATE
ncbi:hypothetical protein CEUSTIGMA_g10010.t1 [Chlamydomonas eustigma]|uniref:TsaA-like domain-containing protein n=1 Tax=Chlamydomonas eustigma TaxID=1157962 RepID=A0A250XHN0_9CHLO|nr:hypothetical protein CEUSTIGMA_g10010.t1 [Chlamydomonas eustigma]|eukprot:GAX82584.1 hypothetical protein CEUSTIGMA_g10010.t1 [Chlamydomonas eustigma]